MTETIMVNIQTPVLINLFSLTILVVFLMDSQYKNRGLKSDRYIFFRYIVIANILLLVTDAVTWLAYGRDDPALRMVQVVATLLYYALNPLPSYFFIRFTDIVLNIPPGKQNRFRYWYIIPVALHLIIAVATPFTGWFYRIDEANVYHRGPLLPLSFILSFLLMIVAAFKVLYRYGKAGKQSDDNVRNITEYRWLLKFIIIPLIGGVVQVFCNNVTYVWNFTVIALLMLYINNQNMEITTDTLTKLYNRRQAFFYFDRLMRDWLKDKIDAAVAVVVLDINNFKAINDRYGHIMGDKALIAVSRNLETGFAWDDFVCRFGGDEFLVITKHGKEKEVHTAINRVNNQLHKLYHKEHMPFILSVSAGFAVLSKQTDTLDNLFQKADVMMFEQKAKLMRRASDRNKPDIR